MSSLLASFPLPPYVGGLVAAIVLVCLLIGTGRRRSVPSTRRTLKTIRRAPLEVQPLLNLSERRVYRDLAQIVAVSGGHTLLAQVSMGEFLRSGGRRISRSKWQTVFNAYNAKRVDFLIVDADWLPCIAIEYQGSGHYKGNARARDAIKRAVCERAGITFMEVAEDGLTPAQVHDLCRFIAPNWAFAAE